MRRSSLDRLRQRHFIDLVHKSVCFIPFRATEIREK